MNKSTVFLVMVLSVLFLQATWSQKTNYTSAFIKEATALFPVTHNGTGNTAAIATVFSDCQAPTNLVVNVAPAGISVIASWTGFPTDSSNGYEYAVTTSTVAPAAGTAILTEVAVVYNLIVNTQYYLHVRSDCGSHFSEWATLAFITTVAPPPANDDCTGAINLVVFNDTCQQATPGTTLSATPSATTPFPICGSDSAGYDDDVWFTFTPAAGQLFVTIDFETTGGTIGLVAQIYTTSDNTASGVFALYACSDDEGPGALPGFYSLPVTPGVTYFIRVFSFDKNVYGQFTICVRKALLINDNATGAIEVKVDSACTGAVYTNKNATQSVGEPAGTCSSTTGYATVWYKFNAPDGGAVKISTATGSGNTLTNTRVALFVATNAGNYSTFSIIGCDEDGGSGAFGNMSVLYATGLTPDVTYYIQVDKFDSTVADGTFCLTVETLNAGMLSSSNTCNSIYQTPVGSIASYTGWVSLMDDSSKLVALVKNAAGAPVNAYTVSQQVHTDSVRRDSISGEYYLNRNYSIKNAITNTSISAQLFFLNSELAALRAVDAAATLSNLRVTRQTSAISCRPDFIAANGSNTEVPQNGNGMVNNVCWVLINAASSSGSNVPNFYIHAVKSYLSTKVFLQGAYKADLGRHKDVTSAWANVLNTYAKNNPYNSPTYEGFGSGTPGGKGQQVVHVTNLNASGPGSLAEAMGSNRTIVFDVGGTIRNFNWSGYGISYLTIDGSTAPSPGITLDNNFLGDCLSFLYGCHDIIVKNVRVRNGGNDGINVVGSHDIVFDHVSSANNTDGDLDITQGSYNITVQWSIFGHSDNGAMLIAYPGTKNISVHHSLFNTKGPGAGERNPLVHNATNFQPNIAPYLMTDFRNNIVWRWGNGNEGYGYGSGVDFGATLQAINNFYQSPTSPQHAIVVDHDTIGSKVYALGNVSGNTGINPNSVSNVGVPWSVAPVTTDPACVAAAKVLAQAGPRPLDSLDQELVGAVSLNNCPGSGQSPVLEAGMEAVSPGFFTSDAAATTDIVDWVLIEIKNTSGKLVAKRAAFVREDGQVVDLDGVSPVALYGLVSGQYYIGIRHRNHLGIRSSELQTFNPVSPGFASPAVLQYDFTTAQNKAYQNPAITTNAAMAESNSTFMMWAGDSNLDGYVRAISQAYPFVSSDINYILTAFLNLNPNSSLSGYNGGDINLDGYVRVISQAFPFISSESSFLLSVTLGNNLSQTIQVHK